MNATALHDASNGAADLGEYWSRLVSCALLGTDRREAPPPPSGVLADMATDLAVELCLPGQRLDAGGRLAQQVAGAVVVRRAGMIAPSVVGPRSAAVTSPSIDTRPVTPPPASARWRAIIRSFPALEDEYLVAVLDGGWRLSPELVPALLLRHRSNPARRAKVVAASGPLAGWLCDHLPSLAPTTATARSVVDPEVLSSLPDIPIPPALAGLLHASPDRVVAGLCRTLGASRGASGHLASLANVVARVPAVALADLARALDRFGGEHTAMAMARSLRDLAVMRAAMLDELRPPADLSRDPR